MGKQKRVGKKHKRSKNSTKYIKGIKGFVICVNGPLS